MLARSFPRLASHVTSPSSPGRRRLHIATPYAAGALALAALAVTVDARPMPAFAALLATAALWAPAGVLHALPASFLDGHSAAAGAALINAIANVGAALGPATLGALKHHAGTHAPGVACLAAAATAAAGLAMALPEAARQRAGGGGQASGEGEDDDDTRAALLGVGEGEVTPWGGSPTRRRGWDV